MFIKRVLELLSQKGISKNKLLTTLSLSQNSFVDWERRGTIPNGDTLAKIADYFNVSVDYLLGRTNIPTHSLCAADLSGFPFFDAIKDCCAKYNVDFNLISDYFLDENRSASLQFVIQELGLKLNDKIFIENLFHSNSLDLVFSSCGYDAQKILPLTMSRREVQLVQLYRQLNEEGQEKLLDASDDLVQSGKYKKRDKAVLDKNA